MSTDSKPCKICNGATSLTALEPIKGEDAGLHVTVKGMPAFTCGEGHKRFLTPEFAMKYIDALLKSDEKLPAPAGEKRGLLRKHYHCAKCGEKLEETSSKTAHVERKVEVQGGGPFKVEMELPLYRCSGCGAENLHPNDEMVKSVMQASANAFHSVDMQIR